MTDTKQGSSPPTQVDDEFANLITGLQSNIGRWVAFVFTPILLPLVGAGGIWLQAKVGIDIQQYGGAAAVTGFIVSTVAGAAAAVLLWLRNRGNHEHAAVETLALLKAGQDSVTQAQLRPATLSPDSVKGQQVTLVGDNQEYNVPVSDEEELANPPEAERPESGQVPAAPPDEG